MTKEEAEKLALEHYYLIKHKVKMPHWAEARQPYAISSVLGRRDINNPNNDVYKVYVFFYPALENEGSISFLLETVLSNILHNDL